MQTLLEVLATVLFLLAPCLLTNFTAAFVVREGRSKEAA